MGDGKTVDADRTYRGNAAEPRVSIRRKGRLFIIKGKANMKPPIISLVELRGRVPSFHVTNPRIKDVRHVVVTSGPHSTRTEAPLIRQWARSLPRMTP